MNSLRSLRNPECDCGPLYYGRHCEFTKSFTGEIVPGQEEQLLTRSGKTAYLFFLAVAFTVFGYMAWHIRRKSRVLAESRRRRVEEESSGGHVQVRAETEIQAGAPALDDVQIL